MRRQESSTEGRRESRLSRINEPKSQDFAAEPWPFLQNRSCSSVTLRLWGCMFSICPNEAGHGYGVQGECIARAWSERRGVSRGLRHRGAVPRGAGPAEAGRTASSAPAAAIGSIACWRVGASINATGARSRHRPRRARSSTRPSWPLTLWFAAIHLIVTAKNGISSVELGRRLGVKLPTAWTVKHEKLARQCAAEGLDHVLPGPAGGDGADRPRAPPPSGVSSRPGSLSSNSSRASTSRRSRRSTRSWCWISRAASTSRAART